MADLIEALTRERDEAQSACTAWQGIYEGLEAHLQDRINMGDQANPEAYLRILRGYVANIIRDSQAICNARWADYQRHEIALSQEREAREKAEAMSELRHKMLTETTAELEAYRLDYLSEVRTAQFALESLAEAKRLLKAARDRIDRYADTADEHCLVAEIDDLLRAAALSSSKQKDGDTPTNTGEKP